MRWERVSKVVEKHAFLYVSLTLVYAFIAGAIVSMVLFRGRFLSAQVLTVISRITMLASLLCTLLVGYILVKVLIELARIAQREDERSL